METGSCTGGITKQKQGQKVLSLRENMKRTKSHHRNVETIIYKFRQKVVKIRLIFVIPK